MQLDWAITPRVSTYHLIQAAGMRQSLTPGEAAGPELVGDPREAAELAQQLAALLTPLLPQQQLFWSHLIPLAAGALEPAALARQLLVKTLGPQASPELERQLTAILRQIDALGRPHWPELERQLALRQGPLAQQWEARGPGLLKALARMTDPLLIAPRATVWPVIPVSAGGGAAHVAYNAVRIEAVLADPLPQLPETLRLGWLLAQLQWDLPDLHSTLLLPRQLEVGALALVPGILAAGEYVELTRCDEATLSLALTNWLPERSDSAGQARLLWDWWQVYQAQRPSLPVALGALDTLLAEA